MTGYPDNNPKTAVGVSKVPLHLVPPSAKHYLALALADYCRKANAYIHFHNVIKAKRKWYKAPGALFVPEILRHCNDSLDSSFTKTPKPLFDAMVAHAI